MNIYTAYMDKLTQGTIAEQRFVVIALSLEIPIYEPVVDICGADFIIKKGSEFVKIQVKSTLTTSINRNTYKITIQRGASSRSYTKGQFDIAACYIFELDIWYFVPFDELKVSAIRINPFKETCKWHRYKNNYSCLID
jgi:hypothetical protein